MRLYDKLLAGVVWLQKFTIFSPQNLRENGRFKDRGIVPWGNYAIGNNLYPNLFNVFVDYSPTVTALLQRKLRFIIGNIPKEIKNKPTTLEKGFSNTLYTLLKGVGRDYILFKGSFAIWVGYDNEGRVLEFKALPLENIRYISRDPALYPHTDSPYMIAIMGEDSYKVQAVYYPYEPERAIEQAEDDTNGQILFYNTATNQHYPDCIFNAMVPIMMTDAGIDTSIMSFLANADLLKTYTKKTNDNGADSVNGIFGSPLINTIWGAEGDAGLSTTTQYGSGYWTAGPKGAGSTEAITVNGEESINDYVHDAKMPAFMDEFNKVDERTARRVCVALEVPYEYFYKMDSGVVNQDNREAMLREINSLCEDDRETIENVVNNILEHSVYDYRLEIRAIGEDREDLRQANDNLTGDAK